MISQVISRNETLVPEAHADDELHARVCQILANQGRPELLAVTINVCAGVVTLNGTVRTFFARQVAVECAKRVVGAESVIDQIQTAISRIAR